MTTARRLFLLCLAVLFSSLAAAQSARSSQSFAVVPRLVNFSGKAMDGGKVITGVAGATFAIYSEESGGSPLWLETQNLQADTKGNYTVQLGATKPDGLPLDLFTSGEARWLGVADIAEALTLRKAGITARVLCLMAFGDPGEAITQDISTLENPAILEQLKQVL